MHPGALHHISLCAALYVSRSLATPRPFYGSLEGSTDEEELSYTTSFVSTRIIPTEYPTTPGNPSQKQTSFPKEFVNFLEENLLLILVTASLVFLAFLIICGAVFMSRKRKVNSYYPSSFPSKMYVDQQDKTGGTKPFNEVQGKAAPEQESGLMDSHKQLQAEIMRAASSLRSPNKSLHAAEGSESCEKTTEQSPECSSKPDHSILDQLLPSLPEEEQCDVPDRGAGVSEQEDSEEPSAGRSIRPSSIHIHNDTATLQLIAGEKTAF